MSRAMNFGRNSEIKRGKTPTSMAGRIMSLVLHIHCDMVSQVEFLDDIFQIISYINTSDNSNGGLTFF